MLFRYSLLLSRVTRFHCDRNIFARTNPYMGLVIEGLLMATLLLINSCGSNRVSETMIIACWRCRITFGMDKALGRPWGRLAGRRRHGCDYLGLSKGLVPSNPA
jgi:hypothetical protein